MEVAAGAALAAAAAAAARQRSEVSSQFQTMEQGHLEVAVEQVAPVVVVGQFAVAAAREDSVVQHSPEMDQMYLRASLWPAVAVVAAARLEKHLEPEKLETVGSPGPLGSAAEPVAGRACQEARVVVAMRLVVAAVAATTLQDWIEMSRFAAIHYPLVAPALSAASAVEPRIWKGREQERLGSASPYSNQDRGKLRRVALAARLVVMRLGSAVVDQPCFPSMIARQAER